MTSPKFALLVAATIILAASTIQASEEDPYLWLENARDAKALQWVAEQNALTRNQVESTSNYREDYAAALALADTPDRISFGLFNHGFVFGFWQDKTHPRGITRRATIESYRSGKPQWETLIDLDDLAAKEHENWFYQDGDCAASLKRCLVSLSRGGSDTHVIREFDLITKTFVPDGFTLAEAKSSAVLVDDNSVLFASDFGPGTLTSSGLPRVVKLWRRGQPVVDAKTVFEGSASDAASIVSAFRSSTGTMPIISRYITAYDIEYYAVSRSGTATRLPLPPTVTARGLIKGQLVLTLRDDWTVNGETLPGGALVATPLRSLLSGKVGRARLLFSPGPRQSVTQVSVGGSAIYASISSNVTGTIHAYSVRANGEWTDKAIDLPANGSTAIATANAFGPEAAFIYENFITPTTLYFDGGTHRPRPIASLPVEFDSSSLITERFQATSSDGTQVPYFVTRPKTLPGPAPTVLFGYGGFEASVTPAYAPDYGNLWLARGGVYVVANIRGGGEFGPAWHQAAMLGNKQKSFDDFAAVAADLERRGITTPKQLGIIGASNGGLLVAAVMIQHPDLFGAVVCRVPVLDMMRYPLFGTGATAVGEWGDPKNSEAGAWLRKYSPYQNVSASETYPPILFETATSDDRATPAHARKMAARMEAQGHSVLFYENTDGGHNLASNHAQVAEVVALTFSFLGQKLGLK